MTDRTEWEHATAQSRRLAIAADAELRRRHPDFRIHPLHSAEPAPISDIEREKLTLVPDQRIDQMAAWIRDLAAQRQAFREKIEERQGLMVPSKDPDWADLGEAFPAWQAPDRDAILQPPKPQITPSAKVLQLAQERDTEPEAADLPRERDIIAKSATRHEPPHGSSVSRSLPLCKNRSPQS
jgi:hypothetical protein